MVRSCSTAARSALSAPPTGMSVRSDMICGRILRTNSPGMTQFPYSMRGRSSVTASAPAAYRSNPARSVTQVGQQRRWRGDPDFAQGGANLRLVKTGGDPCPVELDRAERADQQHLVQFGRPERGVRENVEETAHQRAGVR